MLRFTIPETLPTVNTLLRLHYRKRTQMQRRIAKLVWEALAESGQLRGIGAPMARARIRVKRYSNQSPDADAMHSTAKLLLDALQPSSKRHPYGLGIIEGDSTRHVELHVEHVGKRVSRTDVEIEPL